MCDEQGNCRISRRTAIGQMAASAAAMLGAAGLAGGQDAPKSPAETRKPAAARGGILLERLPNGSEVWQVTTERFDQSNIYCEVPYCSRDSRYFVYARTNPKLSGNRTEFMVVELGIWKQHRLDVAAGASGCAISPEGVFYYLKHGGDNSQDLMRADLSAGTPETVHRRKSGPWVRSLGTVSSDGRYYAGGVPADQQWKMFGVLLVDLQKGDEAIIDRDPFILNPHPQFEPGQGRCLMIQHNRGGTYSPDGKLLRLVGPEGATLYLLSVPDGKRTELQVGKPCTTPATGHEAWIGRTQAILLSVSASGDFAAEKGNLLAIRAGSTARVVSRGYKFNHVGASRCGRFFSADDYQGTHKVFIGSIQTGKSAVVCESKTSPGKSQNTHAHPYLTPDLKWVIFNSNRSGWAHVHAASVPEGMIEELAKA